MKSNDKNNDKNNGTALGLDVGTSRICLANRAGDDYQYRTQLNAFVTLPYSRITESVLKKEAIPHSVNGPEIVVHGNEAEKFADLMDIETRRTMNHGVLSSTESESLSMIRQIIGSLVSPVRDKQKLCYTVPAAALGTEDNLTYHDATLRQILTDLGYEVKSINEGLAVVYAELESTNFTGIGISCGGGLCNVCFSYLSIPVVSFSIPKAGDYIDSSAASMTGERATRIRILKEDGFHFNGFFADKIKQAIGVYYDDMIHGLVGGMKEALKSARKMPKLSRPLPMVLSGGTALPDGFRDRFETILKEQDFPLPVSEIRMAADPLHTAARGALVAALTDM
jgi:actin-like ATPase involved in cell morphogenesis